MALKQQLGLSKFYAKWRTGEVSISIFYCNWSR